MLNSGLRGQLHGPIEIKGVVRCTHTLADPGRGGAKLRALASIPVAAGPGGSGLRTHAGRVLSTITRSEILLVSRCWHSRGIVAGVPNARKRWLRTFSAFSSVMVLPRYLKKYDGDCNSCSEG